MLILINIFINYTRPLRNLTTEVTARLSMLFALPATKALLETYSKFPRGAELRKRILDEMEAQRNLADGFHNVIFGGEKAGIVRMVQWVVLVSLMESGMSGSLSWRRYSVCSKKLSSTKTREYTEIEMLGVWAEKLLA